MNNFSKILLAASALAFLASLTPAGFEFGHGILRPVSAILFVAFMITTFLSEAFANFDREEKAKFARAEEYLKKSVPPPSTGKPSKTAPNGPLRPVLH